MTADEVPAPKLDLRARLVATRTLKQCFERSYAYVASLKPKPITRGKKLASKPLSRK